MLDADFRVGARAPLLNWTPSYYQLALLLYIHISYFEHGIFLLYLIVTATPNMSNQNRSGQASFESNLMRIHSSLGHSLCKEEVPKWSCYVEAIR